MRNDLFVFTNLVKMIFFYSEKKVAATTAARAEKEARARDLHNCVDNDDTYSLQRLLGRDDIKSFLKTNTEWKSGAAPLHHAARLGKLDHLTALLKAGCQPNSFCIEGKYKYTALHWAVHWDTIEYIPLLLEHGADPMLKGNWSSKKIRVKGDLLLDSFF